MLYLKNARAERKDGDLLVAITEGMSRIAAPMIVVASGLAVASKLVVVSRSVVASGLAPRWAAKQPQ
ncbi:hypothetical protein [Pseudomonas sp. TWRC1-2]|uniref:hypothetical protein n=1 Tax=Pseudomonas sp. TWRC1-2 TaxID=2804628 RepID=UPI003CE9F802